MTNYNQPHKPMTSIEEINKKFEYLITDFLANGNYINGITAVEIAQGITQSDKFTQTLKDYGDAVRAEALEEAENAILGEISRCELQAVVESMARSVGHTHSAIHGVKDNNALLVIAHNEHRRSLDLQKEKTVTLEEIKRGSLRGRKPLAMVLDNFALSEGVRDIVFRVQHAIKSLKGNQ